METGSTLGRHLGVQNPEAIDEHSQKEPRAKLALIVDDHDLFRAVLAVVLEQHANFRNVQAGAADEARRALGGLNGRVDPAAVDLAIVDLDLREAAAFGLIPELREARVPVLGLTTSHDDSLRVRALKAGAGEVLTATAPIMEILATARRLARA